MNAENECQDLRTVASGLTNKVKILEAEIVILSDALEEIKNKNIDEVSGIARNALDRRNLGKDFVKQINQLRAKHAEYERHLKNHSIDAQKFVNMSATLEVVRSETATILGKAGSLPEYEKIYHLIEAFNRISTKALYGETEGTNA